MPESEAERQLRLVKKAISIAQKTGGYFEFDEPTTKKIRNDAFFEGLEPTELKHLTIDFVCRTGQIYQRDETDEEWRCRRRFDYYYTVCFDVPGLGRVFVKIVLTGDDEDDPTAMGVGAHESKG